MTRTFVALDLRPERESHLPDLPLCVAAGALASAGADVRQLRVPVRTDALGPTADRLLACLSALRERPDAAAPVVLVERLWLTALLERLRRAGVRVWWLRQDVRDDPGPAVDLALGLDLAAIPALVAALDDPDLVPGPAFARAPDVPGLGWRAPDGAWRFVEGPPAAVVRGALRERWAPRFVRESLPGDPPPHVTEQVLLGNESGCAWRADARRLPPFAALDLDPTCVSVHGCTFCLDGGVHAPESTVDTVAFALRQLEALAGESPDVERLVLADDQPLALLEPLVTAVGAASAAGARPIGGRRITGTPRRNRDAVHGRAHHGDTETRRELAEISQNFVSPCPPCLRGEKLEWRGVGASAAASIVPRRLLVKLRVPDVLRGEESLRRAGRAAAATGWTIELHCVGFEAFVDDLLLLFNKGFRAADAERAALLLHDLARAPGLAAGRSRAHGFLLWTPWTTLPHLLATARAVRRVRFDGLRDDWLDTRLRLDPRQPLHARAVADGLAVAGGPGHAGAVVDRAAAQGYAPAAPWRFADPRAALVDRLLARGDAGAAAGSVDASAADRLERAALAADELTDEAVAVALADPDAESRLAARLAIAWRRGGWEPWHAPVAAAVGLPPAAAAVDTSIATVRAASRRAAIREGIPTAIADDLAALHRDGGLAVSVVPDAGTGEARDLLVARDGDTLAALEAAHARLRARADADAAMREIGALLGYPGCCVAAFAGLPDRGDDLANAIATFRRTMEQGSGSPLDPGLNPFALRQLVPFHPCRYDCAAAGAFAEATLAALRERLGDDSAAAIVRAAAVPLVLAGVRARFALLGARWDDDVLRYDAVAGPPLPEGAALSAALGVRPTPDGLRLVAADGERALLSAARTLLLAWGRAPASEWAVERVLATSATPTDGPALGPAARLLSAGIAAGARLVRQERRGVAEVFVLDVDGTLVRLELAPADPAGRAYAVADGLALSYRVGPEAGPAVPLDRAPPAARRLIDSVAAGLRGSRVEGPGLRVQGSGLRVEG